MGSYGRAAALAALALALPLTALGAVAYPTRVALPNGFAPEGIATKATTFYVGSRFDGAIYRGDLRSGQGSVLVAGQAGRLAGGLKVDQRNRLFVAGGTTGKAFVYDANTGADIAVYQLATPPFTWINDVVVTRTGAWFTDSNRLVLYHLPIAEDGELGTPEVVTLTGDFVPEPGMPTLARANGIEATPDGKTLLFATTNSGKLFAADPATGVTDQIEIAGGPLTTADGILLDGKTLYVIGDGRLTIVQLAPDLSSGTVVARVTDSNFDGPTTVAEHGERLYVVDARITTARTPTTPYWINQLQKPPGQ